MAVYDTDKWRESNLTGESASGRGAFPAIHGTISRA